MAQHAPTSRAGSGTTVSVPQRRNLVELARALGTSVVLSVVLATVALSRSVGTSVAWAANPTQVEVRPAVTPDSGITTADGIPLVTSGGDHFEYVES